MKRLQAWRSELIRVSQTNPPQFIQGVMLVLVVVLALAWWWQQKWQFMLLCLSYSMGVTASLFVREVVDPSPHAKAIQVVMICFMIALVLAVDLCTPLKFLPTWLPW